MPKDLSRKPEEESLRQVSPEQMVEFIIEQVGTIEKLNERIEELNKKIEELEQEIERLKVSRELDSQTSSKPPAGDIIKKSESKPEENQEDSQTTTRKPGGQLGHEGKTRKGFGRVDRYEILRPQVCDGCGQSHFGVEPIKIEALYGFRGSKVLVGVRRV